jgi:Protein of Unknown function (DUF2784)
VRFAVFADIIVLLHFCYVAFTVGGEVIILLGGGLKWRWVRALPFRIVHLAAVVLVAGEALAGARCPLTVGEYWLRVRAGQTAEAEVSFVARLVRSIIFYDLPSWVFLAAYVAFAALVALTFLVFVRPRNSLRRQTGGG